MLMLPRIYVVDFCVWEEGDKNNNFELKNKANETYIEENGEIHCVC